MNSKGNIEYAGAFIGQGLEKGGTLGRPHVQAPVEQRDKDGHLGTLVIVLEEGLHNVVPV